MKEKVAVLIPCYNEELSIGQVVEDFKKELPEADIYVYDNNSTDNTYEIAKNSGAIVRKEHNQGKGNVIRRMFREVEADIYVLVDGDDTYPANEVHKLIKPIIDEEADMVVGDRISSGKYKEENKLLFHEFGNKVVKKAINRLFKSKLNDVMSGYRAFNRIFVKNMPVISTKFEIETEMTLHALDKRFIIKEIPIEYRDRKEGSVSKIDTIPDGIQVLKKIISMYKDYKPRGFFFVTSIVCAIVALIVGVPVIIEFYKTHYITKVPSAILATGIMTLSIIIAQCGAILDTIVKEHKEKFEHQLLNYEQIQKIKGYIKNSEGGNNL